MQVKITDVFRSLGQPTITYVRRDAGKYERLLSGALDVKGQLCLLTGPSKTGKTTLYKRVLEEKKLLPLTVRCDGDLTHEQFWRRALERLDFERVKEHSSAAGSSLTTSGKLSGSIGWKWLAGLAGEVSAGLGSTRSEGEVREKIIANPSPAHLVPVLKRLPLVLVVEDFHYLSSEVQRIIFQQWKMFIDEEVSVIVIGTTHHAIDIATANQDLLGRLCQIDIAQWSIEDLRKILRQGFAHLAGGDTEDIRLPQIFGEVAKESVGLPIITQQTAEQIFQDLDIREINTNTFRKDIIPKITPPVVYAALYNVAVSKYSQLINDYLQLTTGPRKRARKYNTYELTLACFTLEPLLFALMRHEIEERIRKLPVPPDQNSSRAFDWIDVERTHRIPEKQKNRVTRVEAGGANVIYLRAGFPLLSEMATATGTALSGNERR